MNGPPYTVGVTESLTVGPVFWPHKTRPDNLLLLLSYLIPTGNAFPVSPLQGSLPLLSWGLHSSRTPDGGDQVEEGKDEGPSTQTCLGYNL